jgi:DNA replication protein DnaC
MNATETRLAEQLAALKLVAVAEQYAALASEAAQKQWPHVDYLARLVDSEAQRRQELTIQRRIAAARFPCIKTLDQFDWNWPKKINRTQVQNLFRLAFLPDKGNVVFMGGVGLGKSHLACALGHAACLAGHSVLFTTAVDIINTLTAAQAACRLKAELKRLLAPRILCIDEVGYPGGIFMHVVYTPWMRPGGVQAQRFLWGWFLAGWGLAIGGIMSALVWRQVRNIGADAPTM